MKKRFADRLQMLLKQRYGGMLPSLSVLARDISLWAPHLPHVSGEAVRKWLRGDAIPQSPRMQSLADWLGDELLEPFEQTQQNDRGSLRVQRPNHGGLTLSLAAQIEALSPTDYKLIVKLVRSLAEKTSTGNP